MQMHEHKFQFNCNTVYGHSHRITGYTENMMGIDALHVHFYTGISTYTNHTHYLAGMTGLPVKTHDGHIHRMEGILDRNDLHEHAFSDYTSEDIERLNDRKTVEAFGH